MAEKPINDGGPAFPMCGEVYGNPEDGRWTPGMSLRDYFAAQAMHAFFQNEMVTEASGGVGPEQWMRGVARMSYDAADQMIAARGTAEGGAL